MIDLVLVGRVNNDQLQEITSKTEDIINRKIRTLVLDPVELKKTQIPVKFGTSPLYMG